MRGAVPLLVAVITVKIEVSPMRGKRAPTSDARN